jgi:2-(1,2-epoxy-1,2-dihydrophenyl)acetyl-CoA isomerase
MEYETLLVDLKDRVAIVRMNREESMNALEYQLRVDLVNCFKALSKYDEAKVVILTGRGKAFSAGGDLRELKERMKVSEAKNYVLHVSEIIHVIKNLEKPVIAAVNGAAIGAGFSIAMACDLVVASEKAIFSQAFVQMGLIPDLGATYFTPHLIGLQKAKELALTGINISPHELAKSGMINYVVPPEELEAKAFHLARQITEAPLLVLGLTKKLLNQSLNSNLDEMLELEAQAQATCLQSEDSMECIKAFFEKRKKPI